MGLFTFLGSADRALVRRCQDGDETAWHEIVEKYAPVLLRHAQKMGMDREQAKDVAQETFKVLIEKLDTLRDGGGLSKWLLTTASRIVYAEQKKLKSAATVPLLDNLMSPNGDLQAAVERQELLERAEAAMGGDTLLVWRAACDNRIWGDCVALARLLGKPEASVRTAWSRALLIAKVEYDKQQMKKEAK